MGRKQHKYHYIYKTTNLINGKYYIGMHSTSDLNDGYIGSGKKLWYSIKKYGKENFKCEILEFSPDRNSLKNREKQLVNEDILKDPMCMNLKIGGEGGGKLWNEEHKKKLRKGLSKYQKEIWKNPEYRKKITKSLKDNLIESYQTGKREKKYFFNWNGKKHSEETKQKMRKQKNIGESNSQYGTIWITNGVENKKIKNISDIPEGWYKGRKL